MKVQKSNFKKLIILNNFKNEGTFVCVLGDEYDF